MLTRILNRFNLIPIPIYGKAITSTQRFINARDNFSLIKNQQPSFFFLDDSFNHVSILFFSLTISAKTAIKANNIAHGTLSAIQKTQQLNIHTSGLEPAKLFAVVLKLTWWFWSKQYIFLWPVCCYIRQCCLWVILNLTIML